MSSYVTWCKTYWSHIHFNKLTSIIPLSKTILTQLIFCSKPKPTWKNQRNPGSFNFMAGHQKSVCAFLLLRVDIKICDMLVLQLYRVSVAGWCFGPRGCVPITWQISALDHRRKASVCNCRLWLCFQKEERVSALRNQLAERQALRNRRRPSTGQNQNHNAPPPSSQPDPKSLLPPPGYPNPTTDNHSLPPSFSNSSNLYPADSKMSRNHCHNSQIPLLYK